MAAPSYRPFGAYRTLLALLVVPQHIGSPFLTGTAAVYTFFALSGFVIMEAADRFYQGRPFAFGINRALRIVPPFLAALAISLVIYAVTGKAADFGGQNLFKNVLSILPGVEPSQSFMPYAWAIEVELIFYGVIALGILTKFPVLPVVGFLGSASFILFSEPDLCAYIPFFAFGVFCYRKMHLMSVISLILSLYVSVDLFAGNGPLLGEYAIYGHVVALAILLAIIPWLAGAKVPEKIALIDNRVGTLSYPIYLLQHAVIVAVAALRMSPFANAATVYATVIAAAWLFDRLLEEPISLLREKIRGKRVDVAQAKLRRD